MGWVGLVAELVPLPELGTGLGLVTDAAAGTDGAGVTRVEEVVEDGVTAADWLRELEKIISIINSLKKQLCLLYSEKLLFKPLQCEELPPHLREIISSLNSHHISCSVGHDSSHRGGNFTLQNYDKPKPDRRPTLMMNCWSGVPHFQADWPAQDPSVHPAHLP